MGCGSIVAFVLRYDAIFVLFRCGDCVILQFIGVFNGGIGLCLDLIRVKGF